MAPARLGGLRECRLFTLGLFMKSTRANLANCLVALLALAFMCLSPAFAADIPNDDDQDVLIRTTLMTFNDANMTNNYSVFLAKASKEFQSQFTVEKMASAFEAFRSNELYFEDVVTADYDSYEKAKIDNDGALVLAGVFKTEDMEVKYRLRYVQNNNIWKVAGINVDATRKKQ
jgi:opacity protein-like surface antigen